MHKGKYVFAQLLDFIDKDVFLRIANKYDGNRYVKHFTCWNQLAVLMFGQLSNRESLRDLHQSPYDVRCRDPGPDLLPRHACGGS